MKRISLYLCVLLTGVVLMGADGCSSDPNVEGAKLDLRNKDYDRALQNVETALRTNPANAEALELKGQILSEKAFATEDVAEHTALIAQMVEAFNAALAADPTLEPTVQRSLSIAYVNEFQRGIQAFNRARTNSAEYASAAEYFGTASTIRPDSAGAYVNRAYALMNTGNNALAIEPFEMAIAKGDDELDTYRFLADLYLRNGREAEAVPLLERASAMYPDNVDVQTELLNAFQVTGQTDRALALYEAAVEREPDNRLFRFNYGTLLTSAERYDEAIEQLQQAIRIDPEYGNAQYNLGAAFINKAVDVNNRINEIDDNLRNNRSTMTAAQASAAEAEIDRLAEERRSLFQQAIAPLTAARRITEAAGESSTAICQALYQSFVQTNQLEQAQAIAECAGYSDN